MRVYRVGGANKKYIKRVLYWKTLNINERLYLISCFAGLIVGFNYMRYNCRYINVIITGLFGLTADHVVLT